MDCTVQMITVCWYFLLYNKNIQFDFEDELKIGDVSYDNMT